MDEKTIPRRRPEVVSRNVEGEEVLMVPLVGELRVLNTVGSRIWSLIDGGRSIEEIARTIAQDFDVDDATARTDTLAFVRELRAAKVLEPD